MWDEAEFRTKARVYFQRAEGITEDDQLVALLCSLGLEFLLRAPLASVSPLLLADAVADDGYSVLHAAGFPGTKEPVSVKTKAVISRLSVIVDDFETVQQDIQFLIGLRNRELHTSASIYDEIGDHTWLPKFLRAVTVLARHFGEEPSDFISAPFLEHASKLVDIEDGKIRQDVARRLNRAREFAEKLTESERSARLSGVLDQRVFTGRWERPVNCPACSSGVYIQGFPVRYGKEEFDGEGSIAQRVFLVGHMFECTVCGLQLNTTAEIAAAGLDQGWSAIIEESLEERFGSDYYDGPEYENE